MWPMYLAVAFLSLLVWPAHAATDFARIAEALNRLPVSTRILYISAHPDDETPGVLTYLARGLGARVALLSITRGEGGQNVIGREQEVALGLLRTGELLAATRQYGCELYFTRAYDFGFTKSADETLRRWGEREITGEIVARIRAFRPQIVIARWTGTTADRHGQHQAAGILARKAYAAAADTVQFPADKFGSPWQPDSLYLQTRETGPDVVPLPIESYSLLLGGTFHEIGVAGFTEHRTQGMAAAASRYPRWTLGLKLLESRLTRESAPREASALVQRLTVLPQRYSEVSAAWPGLAVGLAAVTEALGVAAARLNPNQPGEITMLLAGVVHQLRGIEERLGELRVSGAVELADELRAKEEAAAALIAEIDGLRLRATTESAAWVGGESYRVAVRVENNTPRELHVRKIELVVPEGWKVERRSPGDSSAGEAQFTVSVPADAPITEPYWRLEKPTDGRYLNIQPEFAGLPFPPPLVVARVDWELAHGEASGTLRAPVESIGANSLRGSLRRAVLVVPLVTVEVLPGRRLVTTGTRAAAEFAVRARYFGSGTADVACVGSPMPPGWNIMWDITHPAVRFTGPRQESLSRVRVTPPPATPPGLTQIPICARLGSQCYGLEQQEVTHPEVTTGYLYHRARAKVEVVALRVPAGLRVGYIAGENDPVPDALEQAGINVTKLDELHLALENLSRFDTLVIGIRAYEVRPDLARLNQRLLDYVKRGGALVVQYQLSRTWNELKPAPFPAEMGPQGDERVTDETSPVRLLVPTHRLLNFPNRITTSDFDGWADERGLYFWKQWDARYTPLVALGDPGEPELQGGLLAARYGKGLYVYTGISFFRQLPAGVPGAFRLFVNLLSAGKFLVPATRSAR